MIYPVSDMNIKAFTLTIVAAVVGAVTVAHAQWVRTPANPIPRTADGKANLTAPPPRAADGKPDLSGVWQAQGSPIPELIKLLPGGANGLGEDIPTKYFINIFADFERGQAPLKPAAAAAASRLSLLEAERDDEGLNCLPVGVPMIDLLPSPFKLIQTPRVLVMLAEAHTAFRQIFTDNRKHPDDPQPSWLGYSIGHWDGDTLIVDTIGFNDRSHFDAFGHMHTTALRVIERFHRRDTGHMDIQITIDDSGVLTRPVTFNVPVRLLPDGDLIEYVCQENEKDLKHVSLR